MSRLITKVPHGEGHTCLAFSKDGKRAYTGGQDCVVLIWKLDEGEDQEPERALQADDAITSLAATHDCWLSGSKDSIVRRYLRDGSTYEGDLIDTRGVPVRDLAIDTRGKRVVIASDDVVAKVVDLEDSMRVQELKGHQRGIRRATWHPSLPLITTCGSDGKIIVWDVSSNEPKIEATLEGIIPAIVDADTPGFEHDCSTVWHGSGQHFFVASRSHEIAMISRSSWSKTSSFSAKDVTGAITALAISPNGLYLASASQLKVYVWSTETKRIIASHNAQGADINQLAFSPRDNLLAWTDMQGSFTRWPKPIPNDLPDPVKSKGATQVVASSAGIDFFDDNLNMRNGVADNEDADLDATMGHVDDGFDDPNFFIDDLGVGLRDEPEVTKHEGYVKEMVSITKAQPSFQPGSSPLINRKRYLAYNLIGIIEATHQEEHQIVNIDFFDHSTRQGFHFVNHFMYDLGYLGERGALFACQPSEEHPAHVCFKPYGQWTSQREWTYELGHRGTRVLGIAAGAMVPLTSLRQNEDSDLQGYGNIVIATNEGDLTFLSGTGRERRIMGFGAEFVTMVASSEWVFVVHREGSTTIDGSQNLSYSIINFEDFSVRQHGILPISKSHLLKWTGLTDQSAPVIYDSTGYVHILTKYRIPHHASWARVMDTNLLERRAGKDESYWPVGVTSTAFFCIILKGRQGYPGFPRPLIQELPLHMPFRGKEPKEELVERELLFVQIDLDSLDEELTTNAIATKERALDKELILLIQMACKDPADNPRAIELTKLLHNIISIDAAIKIAEFYHLAGLKEKMQLIRTDREENEDRLIVARSKRRRWLKPDPLPREILSMSARHRRPDPLAENYPPPIIERPGLTRVTSPVIEPSQYAKQDTGSSSHLMRDTSLAPEPIPSPDIKRKREAMEESQEDEFTMRPRQKLNPFAKRPGQETLPNPFVRKLNENKVIHKSESFFEKVDAATLSSGKTKRSSLAKDKKEGRQTTLLGMVKSHGKIATKSRDLGLEMPESQVSQTVSEISASDIIATDIGDEDASSDWQETQPVEDTVEGQLANPSS
ncbi:hypothetical protein AX17_005761 [Amanita inopinata Kibby_2008]|nr:hypothetical protein AX17_005761 [Amanita inopinata Kibby_2008]